MYPSVKTWVMFTLFLSNFLIITEISRAAYLHTDLQENLQYYDIFGSDVDKQIQMTILLQIKYK